MGVCASTESRRAKLMQKALVVRRVHIAGCLGKRLAAYTLAAVVARSR